MGLGVIETALSAPLSHDDITVTSPNISGLRLINMGWYTDTANVDAQVPIAAVSRIRQVFTPISNTPTSPDIVSRSDVQTDQQLLGLIRTTITPFITQELRVLFNDAQAILDMRARVIDVQSPGVFILLAVLFIPSRHPRAMIYMLAKKNNVDDIKRFCGARVLRSALGATAELNRCSPYALI